MLTFRCIEAGGGRAVEENGVWKLMPRIPEDPVDTWATAVLSDEKIAGKFVIQMKTLAQLRRAHPQPFEVAAAVFGAEGPHRYYSALVTPNGVQVVYYDDDPNLAFPLEYLAVAKTPVLELNKAYTLEFNQGETGVEIRVNGMAPVYVRRPVPAGRVGFIVEDAVGQFRFLEEIKRACQEKGNE